MKKIFFAVMIAALVIALYVTTAYAMEAETEPVVETEAEADTYDETETETETVDGAIVEDDYLSQMLEGANQWLKENPTMVGSTACSGLTMAAAVIIARVTKKERENGKEREERSNRVTATLNNNAVEIMETTKGFMKEGKDTINQSVETMMGGFKGIGDEIVEELRANRRETRANSFLIAKLLEKARLPAVEKEEILSKYKSMLGEEADVDDEID